MATCARGMQTNATAWEPENLRISPSPATFSICNYECSIHSVTMLGIKDCKRLLTQRSLRMTRYCNYRSMKFIAKIWKLEIFERTRESNVWKKRLLIGKGSTNPSRKGRHQVGKISTSDIGEEQLSRCSCEVGMLKGVKDRRWGKPRLSLSW